jgi:hypothetical protein
MRRQNISERSLATDLLSTGRVGLEGPIVSVGFQGRVAAASGDNFCRASKILSERLWPIFKP